MRLTEAINALIALLSHCELPDGDDFAQHTFYKTVRFVPEYPLGAVDVPVVAFWSVGGLNRPAGLGKRERWHGPRLQMDILATNALEARRIYEKVWEVVLFDYSGGAGEGAQEGSYGKRYLYGQGLKSVEINEPRSAVWDEEGRIARLVADVTVTFRD